MIRLLIGTFTLSLLLGLPACTSEDSGPLEGGTPEQAAAIWLIYGGGLRAISPCAIGDDSLEFNLSPGESRTVDYSQSGGAAYRMIGCASEPIEWEIRVTPDVTTDIGISLSTCDGMQTLDVVNDAGVGGQEVMTGSGVCTAGFQQLNTIFEKTSGGTATVEFIRN